MDDFPDLSDDMIKLLQNKALYRLLNARFCSVTALRYGRQPQPEAVPADDPGPLQVLPQHGLRARQGLSLNDG